MMLLGALLMTIIAGGTWYLVRIFSLPTLFLCGAWGGVFFLQACLANDMYLSITAVVIISAIVFCFACGNVLGGGLARRSEDSHGFLDIKKNFAHTMSHERVKWVVLFFCLISVIGAFQYIKALGLLETGSIAEMFTLIGANRGKLMTGEIQVSAFDKIGFLFSYSGFFASAGGWFSHLWRFCCWESPRLAALELLLFCFNGFRPLF
jgi:hypothetical protein